MGLTSSATAVAALLVVVTGGMPAARAEPGNSSVTLVGDFAHWEKKAIAESSGLIWWRDHLITTNDSGDQAVLYVADRTGRETARLHYADAHPSDVEALALGPDETVWVGDIGDNTERRDRIAVYRVPSPGLDDDSRVRSTRYDLRYQDGPHNAEALLVHPVTGVLYVVTKALVGAVYRAPQPLESNGVNLLAYVGPAPTIVTDATFAPNGAQVYLRGYTTLTVLDYPAFTQRATWRTPAQPQGEGLANGPDGTLLASTEGVHTAIQQWRMPAAAATASPTAGPSSPGASAVSSPGTSAVPSPGAWAPGTADSGPRWRIAAGVLTLAAAVAGGFALGRNRRRPGRL